MDILKIHDYQINTEVLIKKIDDVVMVYNKGNGDMYEINDVGGEIFDLLLERVPVCEIITKLEKEYDAPLAEIEEATRDFLCRMIELGVMLI